MMRDETGAAGYEDIFTQFDSPKIIDAVIYS
jgi:hypothetical protein